MRKKLKLLHASLFLLSALLFFFAAASTSAGELQGRIKALEEVQRANAEELERLKGDQIKLNKEATAAAAALPSFAYRPGRGMTIEAGDRRWSLTFTYELEVYITNMLKGNDARGFSEGDIFFRRNHPFWFMCVNGCFYDWGIGIDLDTLDTANDFTTTLVSTPTGTALISNTRKQSLEANQWFSVNFQQINPYFPKLTIADNASAPYGGVLGFPYVSSSSIASATKELASELMADSATDELGWRGIGLSWVNIPVGVGDVSYQAIYKPGAPFKLGSMSDTDGKQFQTTFGTRPFNRSKNPWLEKIKWGVGLQVDSIDARSAFSGARSSSPRARLRMRTFERVPVVLAVPSALTLLDTRAGGPGTASIGEGLHTRVETGLEWGYGPYLTRIEGGWSRFRSGPLETGASDGMKGPRGNYWRIGHDLFIWSPKGPLTGSPGVAGSVQVGYAFGRADGDCGKGADCSPGAGRFRQNFLRNNEIDLWYHLAPGFRVGMFAYFWHSANTPVAVQPQTGCTRNVNATNPGKGCDWLSVNIGLNANF